MNTEPLKRLARMVPLGSVAWFDLLDGLGLFQKWIASDDPEKLGYVIWNFSEPLVRQDRGDRIAELARPALLGGGTKQEMFLRVFHSNIHVSRKLFDLSLELLDAGALDSQTAHFWNEWHDLGEKDPAKAAELANHVMDRLQRLAEAAGKESPFDRELPGPMLPEGIISAAAMRNPAAVVERLLPRVVELVRRTALPPQDDKIVFDRVWAVRSWGFHHDLSAEILGALSEAMGLLARDQPKELDKNIAALDLRTLPHQTIAYLLLSAWTDNGNRYADQIAEYMLGDVNRLNIGYSTWGTGNGIAAVSRAALMAGSPFFSNVNFQQLERTILQYYPPIEKEQPKRLGYTQFLLLTALGQTRLSSEGKRRFGELSRKFEGVNTSLPGPTEGAVWIGSPVPEKAAEHMTDEQWLAAMRQYNEDNWKTPSRNPADFFKGGAVELSRLLEAEARKDKGRFCALALRFDETILPFYWEAVLRGIASRPGEVRPKVTTDEPEELPVDTAAAASVIRHAKTVVGDRGHVARWICHAIGKLANHDLPNDLVELVAHYAVTAADPTEELWQETTKGGDAYYGGDPVTFGINTTRGEAAHVIASLLFADPARYQGLKAAIESLVKDRSLAVRACSVECLIAVLRIDGSDAVAKFIELTKDDHFPLGTMFVEHFLHYAVYTNYEKLRELLLKMLRDGNADVRKTAAQQVALASFRNSAAQQDLALILQIDAVCRAAVAQVDAANLHVVECRDAARTRLMRHFEDESAEVRDAASRCFLQIGDDQLCEESDLITAFIASPAFEANAYDLLHSLERSAARLPDVVCRIGERAAEIRREQKEDSYGHWWTSELATLILRLYEQTRDESIKTRCLNVIDSMIEFGFGNVTPELAKIER
jgi:HEAT repeat protein